MLQNILNLNGVEVLNKQQQSSIKGAQDCVFSITYDDGSTGTYLSPIDFADGEAGSAQANQVCVDAIFDPNDSVAACGYNCEYDGFEQ